MKKYIVEIPITPARTGAIMQYIALVEYWNRKLYTSKGLPYTTSTDDETQLKIIEDGASMKYDDGGLFLSTSMRCQPYATPQFFKAAYYGENNLSLYDLRRYLRTRKMHIGTLFDEVA